MQANEKNLQEFLCQPGETVLVEVVSAKGSTPRDEGVWMLVNASGIFKTIGGGQLEYMAIDQARALLSGNSGNQSEMNIPLGPSIGQCCGGAVRLELSIVDEEGRREIATRFREDLGTRPHVYVFGAGHVGIALVEVLSLLPVHVELVDSREIELQKAGEGITKRLVALPETVVRQAPANSAFIILTHDHALDFLLTQEALSRGDAAYVGMIGSDTKRATFVKWLQRESGAQAVADNLVCPIGGSELKDKRPEVIATLTAAEVMIHLGNASDGISPANPKAQLDIVS